MHYNMTAIQNHDMLSTEEVAEMIISLQAINTGLLSSYLELEEALVVPNVIRYQPIVKDDIYFIISKINPHTHNEPPQFIVSIIGDDEYRNRALDALAILLHGHIEEEPYQTVIIPATIAPELMSFSNFTKPHHLYLLDILIFSLTSTLAGELEKVTRSLSLVDVNNLSLVK